jgi:hypothetical protein
MEVLHMQAYEFYATPENGTIKIPDKYKDLITTGVKVIILEQKTTVNSDDNTKIRYKSDLLLSPSITTNGWRFNREDANER